MNSKVKGLSMLGRAIKEYRASKGLTQTEFAELAGVTTNTVYTWENNIIKPGIGAQNVLSKILELPISDIIDMANKECEEEPVLVVMAAGMGSRYGGLKQIDVLNKDGDIIIDFSVYDAIRAGFKKVIFIIRRENEKDFRRIIGDKISPYINVEYAYQDIEDIPDGIKVPAGREKPWGTGHAILSCKDMINGPFLVINSDDYYGAQAFKIAYDFLSEKENEGEHMMVGYLIENTLTDNGYVSRGICTTDKRDQLTDIKERKRIEKLGTRQSYLDDDGITWVSIPKGTIVSMNMWGFSRCFLDILEEGFMPFLEKALKEDPDKAEYLLPEVVGEMIQTKKGRVHVMKTADKWYGVTYKEDKEKVVKAVRHLKGSGLYPIHLWKKI